MTTTRHLTGPNFSPKSCQLNSRLNMRSQVAANKLTVGQLKRAEKIMSVITQIQWAADSLGLINGISLWRKWASRRVRSSIRQNDDSPLEFNEPSGVASCECRASSPFGQTANPIESARESFVLALGRWPCNWRLPTNLNANANMNLNFNSLVKLGNWIQFGRLFASCCTSQICICSNDIWARPIEFSKLSDQIKWTKLINKRDANNTLPEPWNWSRSQMIAREQSGRLSHTFEWDLHFALLASC